MSDPEAIWVYAVAKRGALPDDGSDGLVDLVGIAGRSVRLIGAADLVAVASPVELAEFGEEPLRRNMENLPWLEAVARLHHDVVSAIAEITPVVPMRLATVYRSDEGLVRMLGQRQQEFLAALGRIAGRIEFGVKAYVATNADAVSPPTGQLSAVPPARGSGTDYLMKRRAQLTAAEDARKAAVASAERVHRELAGQAVAAALHRPQDPQLSGATARMIMNAAYLLDDKDRVEFAAAVERAGSANPAVRLELTGPWPPYSFAAVEPGAATAGAGAAR